MYNNNNNKSQQYLLEKIAKRPERANNVTYRLTGKVVVLAAARPFIFFSETSINAKQLALANYSV